MEKEIYYVKSFEEDFSTKTLKGTEKVTFQKVNDIIKTKKIKPNTKSFGRQRRLSTTIIHKNYLVTYRCQGIIFQTEAKPDYVLPFDLVLLSATDRIIVHYYRIKNNLHVYYNHSLIPGFEKFIFKNFDSLIEKYDSPWSAWKAVNEFRIKNGYKPLTHEKYRLVMYNEVVFNKTIKIKPVAIFGYSKDSRKIAQELNLPHYNSAKQFYEKRLKE
jgi:hypothetical protein